MRAGEEGGGEGEAIGEIFEVVIDFYIKASNENCLILR